MPRDVTPPRYVVETPVDAAKWLRAKLVQGESKRFALIALLTPELAALVLESHNGRNRRPSKASIKRYVEDILRKEWGLTHEALAFGTDNQLNDGQSRCQAVIDANSPIPVTMWFGCDSEEFQNLDAGRKRKPADDLVVKGFDWENTRQSMAITELRLDFRNRRAGEFSRHEITAKAEAMDAHNPELLKLSMQVGLAVSKEKPAIGLSPTAAAYAFWHIANATKYSLDDVKQFFEELRTGSANKSIQNVRAQFADDISWKTGWDVRDKMSLQSAAVILCWNRVHSKQIKRNPPKRFKWDDPRTLPLAS